MANNSFEYICKGAHCKCMNLDGQCTNFHNGDHTCPHSFRNMETREPLLNIIEEEQVMTNNNDELEKIPELPIRDKILLLLEDFQECDPSALLKVGELSFDEKFVQLFDHYAEQRATERVEEEVEQFIDKFMDSLGPQEAVYLYDRIAQLKATQQKSDTLTTK